MTQARSHKLLSSARAKPFSLIGDSIGRAWTDNPLVFILQSGTNSGRAEAGIKIDWEHEGYEWFDPDAIDDSENFERAPRILESLQKVWFNVDLSEAAGNTLDQGLIALHNNHESGAHQLASVALHTYSDVIISKIDISDKDRWWRNVRLAGWLAFMEEWAGKHGRIDAKQRSGMSKQD
ncbi:hypothetical protein HYE68_009460 [Fusarium pseudograminearum]|nr:hypothetical protein HYE68_009460 [Fusarium pseudograminearum]